MKPHYYILMCMKWILLILCILSGCCKPCKPYEGTLDTVVVYDTSYLYDTIHFGDSVFIIDTFAVEEDWIDISDAPRRER